MTVTRGKELALNYLHYEFDLNGGDTVEVILDSHANVRLMDNANFALYQAGKRHFALGGFARTSPIHITAPSAGHWHVVVDLGGFPGTVRATAHVLQGA